MKYSENKCQRTEWFHKKCQKCSFRWLILKKNGSYFSNLGRTKKRTCQQNLFSKKNTISQKEAKRSNLDRFWKFLVLNYLEFCQECNAYFKSIKMSKKVLVFLYDAYDDGNGGCGNGYAYDDAGHGGHEVHEVHGWMSGCGVLIIINIINIIMFKNVLVLVTNIININIKIWSTMKYFMHCFTQFGERVSPCHVFSLKMTYCVNFYRVCYSKERLFSR